MGKVYDPGEVDAVATRLYDPSEVEAVAPEKTTQGEAVLHNAAQGASFGTADELTGVAAAILDNPVARKIREKLGIFAPPEAPLVATTREGKPLSPPVDIAPKSFGDAYRAGRDSAREDLEQTRKDWRKTALVSEIGGALLTPIKLPGGAVANVAGAGTKLKAAADVARVAGRAGVEAAAYGAGSSTADLTQGEVGQFLKDTGTAGVVGLGVGGAAATGGKLLRAGAESVVTNLEQRVLNELAEAGPRSVKDKVRAKLAKAGRDILGEVVEGPDAETVRKAMQSPKAAEGRKLLRPVLDSVDTVLDDGYQRFRDAGKNLVDSEAYYLRLTERAADPALSTLESQALNKLADSFDDLVKRNKGKPVDLQRLRKFTTETQSLASQVTSDPSVAGKLRLKMSAIATDAMDDTLGKMSAGNKTLEASAESIRAANKRMYGLLTIDNALESRVGGEASARSSLVRIAEKAATPASVLGVIGGAGLIASDPEQALQKGGIGLGLALAARGLPAAARALERGITTRAINAVRAAPGAGRTVRERVAEKLKNAGVDAKRFETYGKAVGGLAGRAAMRDEEDAR